MGDSSDEETIVDQFKPELLSLDSLNYLVIDLKELDIKKPVAPDAKLYHSVWNTSTEQKTVAVKLLGKVNERELDVLSGIQHKNIVRFFGAIYEPPINYGLVLEMCEKGSLFDYIQDPTNPLELPLALKVSRGIISGVRYLHRDAPDSPIKHNNLNSHEVVLQEVNGELIPKISGFGYARHHSESQMTTSRGKVNINALMSPERIRGERSSPESDIYSVGIIMSELLSRKVPFEGVPVIRSLMLVDKGERPVIPPSCPKKFASLITVCWDEDPDERPTAGEVEARLDRFIRRPSILKAPEKQVVSKGAAKKDVKRPSLPIDQDETDTRQQRPVSPNFHARGGSVIARPPTCPWMLDDFDDSTVDSMHGVLGSGRIGVVKKAMYRGKPVAVKGINQFLMDGFGRYMESIYSLRHDNVVSILGATTSFLVFEEMPMSLKSHLAQGPITDKKMLLKIALDVASGLHYLHTLPNPMCHGSMHSRNVFLDDKHNAKISDFGYIILDHEVGLEPTSGMEKYHAPEGKQRSRYGIGVDIYSFGILLVEMRTLDYNVSALKNSWNRLYKLAEKYTQKGQDGMYARAKMTGGMISVLNDLEELIAKK